MHAQLCQIAPKQYKYGSIFQNQSSPLTVANDSYSIPTNKTGNALLYLKVFTVLSLSYSKYSTVMFLNGRNIILMTISSPLWKYDKDCHQQKGADL